MDRPSSEVVTAGQKPGGWRYFVARSALEWGRRRRQVDADEYRARRELIEGLWARQCARDPRHAGAWAERGRGV